MTLRRTFVTLAAGAVAARTVLPAVAHAAPTDALLINLGHAFDRAAAEEQAAWDELGNREDEAAEARVQKLNDASRALADQIEATRAQTLAGLQVKIRAIAWCHAPEKPELTAEDLCPYPCSPSRDIRLVADVIRDLTAMGRAGV